MQTSRFQALTLLCVAAALIAGCGSPRKTAMGSGSDRGGGGYYLDDGPGNDIPHGIENTPDAVPRIEPYNPANFRPYTVMGQRFRPIGPDTPLKQRGVASWYGRKFHGQKTANGETYDMYAMTAAHPTLPLPSYALVTHVASGRSVIVRVNDRGPFLRGRVIDLSYAAAAKLGIIGRGSDVVTVEAITHADIRKGTYLARGSTGRQVASAHNNTTIAPSRIRTGTAPAAGVAAPSVHKTVEPTTSTPDVLAALNLTPSPMQATATPGMHDARTPAPTITENSEEGVYLQFGAFGNPHSADRLANQLNAELAQVETRIARIHRVNDLHRVRIGPYASRTEAVNAAVRIQEATGMQPTLAQR